MDIERLKELKGWVNDLRKFGVNEGNEVIAILDEAIARQSVKSEEVAEAIEALKVCAWGNPDMSKQINLGIVALQQMRTPVEPIIDHWAVCPECGYEYILEIMVDYATSDEWLVKYCPECGQPFKYDDQWKDDDGKTNLKWKKALHGEQWIPVSDRLPAVDDALCQMVFTWSEKKKELEVQHWRHVRYDPDTTHWCPLPEPPKGE